MVVLVRHAEKDTATADDPPLSAAGQERAQALADALRDAGVTAIVTTQLRRTRDTAAPIAVVRSVTPEVISADVNGDVSLHAKAVADAVKRHAGGVVLVVGHSNTVPEIIAALGGPHMPEICESLFANLYVLVPVPGGARLVQSRYGAADPPAADCE
jgi:broad specificity phosphatase PhoE